MKSSIPPNPSIRHSLLKYADHIYVNCEELRKSLNNNKDPPPLPPRSRHELKIKQKESEKKIFNDLEENMEELSVADGFSIKDNSSFTYFNGTNSSHLRNSLYSMCSSILSDDSSSKLSENIDKSHICFNKSSLFTTPLTTSNELLNSYDYFFPNRDEYVLYGRIKKKQGILYKASSCRKSLCKRNVKMDDEMYFFDFVTKELKESLELSNITYVGRNIDKHFTDGFFKKFTSKSNDICFFDVGTSKYSDMLLYGCDRKEMVNDWITHISIRIKPKFCKTTQIYENISSCGYFYLRTSISESDNWTNCWLIVKNRRLYIIPDIEALEKINILDHCIDLRKVLGIDYSSTSLISSCNLAPQEGRPIYIKQLNGKTIYLQCKYKNHTEAFLKFIKHEWAVPVDGELQDQLLWLNNVPVAVKKCINFICTYKGIFTEGIYKEKGDEDLCKFLLQKLKSNDVHNFSICAEKGYTAIDVAWTLKKYLSSFQECIFTNRLLQEWIDCMQNMQLVEIKNLLSKLPIVNYSTLRTLMIHFRYVIENNEKNGMDKDNLCKVIAPYLFYSEKYSELDQSIPFNIVSVLLNSYLWLFDIKHEELSKEDIILDIVSKKKYEAHYMCNETLIHIYLYDKRSDITFSAKVNSDTTAHDVILSASAKMNLPSDKLSLFEVVCDGQLERFLHYTELMKPIVSSWIDWPENSVKTNYLVLKENKYYKDIDLNSKTYSLFNKLSFRGEKDKKFRKNINVQFVGAKLSIYLDMKGENLYNSWNIEKLVWYIGCEMKKNHSKPMYAFTFIEKGKKIVRSKYNNFIGWTILCNNESEFNKWMNGMINAEYPNGLKAEKYGHLNQSFVKF